MRSQLIPFLRGYVKIEIRGPRIVELLNATTKRQFQIWDVRRKTETATELNLTITDFFRLRPLLKQTGCRMHVLERRGVPFRLRRLEHRKGFLIGLIGFLIGLFVLSSLVWRVDIEGNVRLPDEEILAAAHEAGIYPLQWKFRLRSPDALAHSMAGRLPGAAWIGVEVHGTRIRIQVVESKQPDPSELSGPRHLIATSDAVVTHIYAETGKPLVKPNTHVRKGDILISGVIGDEEHRQAVIAKGEVRGLVWHEYQIGVPLVQKVKSYTGASRELNYIVIGHRALKISGYGKADFTRFETITTRKSLQFRDRLLPLGWMHEKRLATRIDQRKLSRSEAEQLGLQQAKAEIWLNSGRKAEIVSQKILQETEENGKLQMKVLFEVEQEIARELPIVPEGAGRETE